MGVDFYLAASTGVIQQIFCARSPARDRAVREEDEPFFPVRPPRADHCKSLIARWRSQRTCIIGAQNERIRPGLGTIYPSCAINVAREFDRQIGPFRCDPPIRANRALRTLGRIQSIWMCSWSWLREPAALIAMPIASRGSSF
jgi:hypothetical protein